MNRIFNRGLAIFFLALTIRVIAAGITTVTDLNPDSRADAVGFGQSAEMIARGITSGQPYLFISDSTSIAHLLNPFGPGGIYQLWGTFLAPFWLLPGPSGFYARLGNALLAAYAIYNVYLIASYYHSDHAGIIATLPMIFYPSFVAVQSTLLREAMVLFCITIAAKFLITPYGPNSKGLCYLLAGGSMYIALILRPDNLLIYIVVVFSAIAVYMVYSGRISKWTLIITGSLLPFGFIFALPYIQSGVQFLARTRQLRGQGRAVYLADVVPQTISEVIAFSWIGAAYFLYAPFPWMISTVPDLIISIEGIITIIFTITAVWGLRSFSQKNPPVAIGLIIGFSVAIVLYGIGTVNYGTGMRHRQMFLWIVFLFGGIGLSDHIHFTFFSSEPQSTLD